MLAVRRLEQHLDVIGHAAVNSEVVLNGVLARAVTPQRRPVARVGVVNVSGQGDKGIRGGSGFYFVRLMVKGDLGARRGRVEAELHIGNHIFRRAFGDDLQHCVRPTALCRVDGVEVALQRSELVPPAAVIRRQSHMHIVFTAARELHRRLQRVPAFIAPFRRADGKAHILGNRYLGRSRRALPLHGRRHVEHNVVDHALEARLTRHNGNQIGNGGIAGLVVVDNADGFLHLALARKGDLRLGIVIEIIAVRRLDFGEEIIGLSLRKGYGALRLIALGG